MTLILSPEEVRKATDIAKMVDVIEEGIREQAAGTVEMPPRTNLPTSNGFFRVMPAVMKSGGVMGIKIFNGSVEHGVRYVIAIYDEVSGELLVESGDLRVGDRPHEAEGVRGGVDGGSSAPTFRCRQMQDLPGFFDDAQGIAATKTLRQGCRDAQHPVPAQEELHSRTQLG